VVVLRIGAFLLKVLAVVFLQLQLRWTVPRFRYDQIMSLGWKILLPASLINLVVTAIAMLFL
jgi:NADH-quinone oxidoreductase subunit H